MPRRLQGPPDRLGTPAAIGFRGTGGLQGRVAPADDLVDFTACGRVVPSLQLTQQDHAAAGAALVTEKATGAFLVVESEPIPPATEWAGTVLVLQEPGIDP